MKKYWALFKISITREMAYRFDFVIDFVFNILGLLVMVFLRKFVFSANESIYGFSFPQLVTYYFLVFLLSILSARGIADHLMRAVHNGRLSTELVKPQNLVIFLFIIQ